MNTYIGSEYHKHNLKKAGVKGNLVKINAARLREIEYNKNPKLCRFCEYPISYKKKDTNKFCSKSCSAKHVNKLRKPRTIESKLKTSQKMLLLSLQFKGQSCRIKHVNCCVCAKLFTVKGSSVRKTCSKRCHSEICSVNGRKNRVKRSKDEIKLYELCLTRYKNVKHNEEIVAGWDADIFLKDYNLAIFWNGPWHYREMKGVKNHSLKQVQNRDKIKLKLFTQAGVKVLTFEDKEFTPESAFTFLTGYISSLS